MTTVAVAGRLIDQANAATPRFPLANKDLVHDRLVDHLRDVGTTRLVSSAACGADLLALGAAAELGIDKCIVVLPFDVEVFRASSVTSRPGDWNARYDRAIAAARARDTLVVLGFDSDDKAAYAAATRRILEEAALFAPDVRAAIVWEATRRGDVDHSDDLGRLARARGWTVDTVSTR